MKLSEHFSLYEFERSYIAERLGIDNSVPESLLDTLLYTANMLEVVRSDVLHGVIDISSGYRCLELNRALKSKDTSDHVKGLAVDFTCPTFGSPLEVCTAIVASDVDYQQVIYEFGRWCHLSFPVPGGVGKRQVLTIDRRGTRAGLPIQEE